MKNRLALTLLVPTVAVSVYAVTYLVIARFAPGRIGRFRDVEPFATQMISSAGCIVGALSFARGDYLRSAWGLLAIGDLLLLLTVALTGTLPLETTLYPRVAATILANVLDGVGAYRFASAALIAGVALPASQSVRRSGMLLGFIVGCLIGVPSLIGDAHVLARDGNLESLIDGSGALGDVAGLTLFAPVLLTAFALRGGRVFWVWGLLSATTACWLCYDLAQGLTPAGASEGYHAFSEGIRVAALGCMGAAGLAQRIVMITPAAVDADGQLSDSP